MPEFHNVTLSRIDGDMISVLPWRILLFTFTGWGHLHVDYSLYFLLFLVPSNQRWHVQFWLKVMGHLWAPVESTYGMGVSSTILATLATLSSVKSGCSLCFDQCKFGAQIRWEAATPAESIRPKTYPSSRCISCLQHFPKPCKSQFKSLNWFQCVFPWNAVKCLEHYDQFVHTRTSVHTYSWLWCQHHELTCFYLFMCIILGSQILSRKIQMRHPNYDVCNRSCMQRMLHCSVKSSRIYPSWLPI